MMDPRTLGVYVVTSGAFGPDRDHRSLARAAIDGGATAVQLRAPELDDEALLPLAIELAAACRDAGVLFVVNDRLEVALESDAAGVHLGQHDDPHDARAATGCRPRARRERRRCGRGGGRGTRGGRLPGHDRVVDPDEAGRGAPRTGGARCGGGGHDAARGGHRRDLRLERRARARGRRGRVRRDLGRRGSGRSRRGDALARRRRRSTPRERTGRRDERAADGQGDGGAVRTGDPAAPGRVGRGRAGRTEARRRRRRGAGRRRRRDGRHDRSGVRRPRVRLGARGVVRRAHPGVGRRHERAAAPMDGGGPEPAARDQRRGSDVALGRVLAHVRGPGHRGRDRTHGAVRRVRVADGGRRHVHGARAGTTRS